MSLPLHQQLAFLAGLFCLLIVACAIVAAVTEVRRNRKIKRDRLSKVFDPFWQHRE